MALILLILLYFLIGLIIAYFKTPDRATSFDLNKTTLMVALKWPKIIYDLIV